MPDAAGSPSTADVPPVWWSTLFGPIEESKDRHGDKYVGFSRQSLMWVGLADLPADAVRLVPAGGSARADNELLREAGDALRAVGKAALVVRPTLDQPYPDAPSQSPWSRFMEKPARNAYNLGSRIRAQFGAGGSAPHQGATTDETAP